jgi:gliding motility-associated lipoprotein GldH
MRKLLLGTLSILFFIVSCDENSIYDEYVNLPDAVWDEDNIVDFNFTLDDSISKNQVYIKIRNTVDYPYSNLYLFTKVNFPDGKVLIDTLEYEMTDAEGLWLGDGVSGLKSNLLYFKKDVIFYKKGDYNISIQHGMRTDNLEGIQDVGLRIERN